MNSIKLNGNNDLEALRQSQRTDSTRDANGAKPVGPDNGALASPADSIEVSGRAAAIRRFIEQAGELPAMRMDEIARYKAEIEAGTYHPEAASIADALLKSSIDENSW